MGRKSSAIILNQFSGFPGDHMAWGPSLLFSVPGFKYSDVVVE